jgi:DNA-binding NarL/FixJ family response regulator
VTTSSAAAVHPATAVDLDPLRRAAAADDRVWDSATVNPLAVLRERDLAVAEAVAEGWSTDDVAAVLHIRVADVAYILAHPRG